MNNIDPNRGFTGLANLGNTCFLNSCVQALSHTHELTHFLSSDKYKKHINKGNVSTFNARGFTIFICDDRVHFLK